MTGAVGYRVRPEPVRFPFFDQKGSPRLRGGGVSAKRIGRVRHRRCDRAERIDRRTLDDLSRTAAALVATALDPRKAGR